MQYLPFRMEQVVASARLESLDSGFARSFGKLEALLKQAKEARDAWCPRRFGKNWSCTEPGCHLHALERRPPSPQKQHYPSTDMPETPSSVRLEQVAPSSRQSVQSSNGACVSEASSLR